MFYRIIGLLFICLWINNIQIKADVADTLYVETEENDWEGGLDISVKTDSSGTSVTFPDIDIKRVMVYNLAGHLIQKNVLWTDALKGLPKGIYIINRRKYIIH